MVLGKPSGMQIDDLLRIAMERRASDLHLKVGNYPHLRIDGELAPLTEQPRVTAEDMLAMAFSMMSARQKQKFKETSEIDMAYGVAGLGRFRVNVFQQRGNVGLVLRVIPTKIRALDELYLPKIVEQICEMPRGLILVTGVTGSGKSTRWPPRGTVLIPPAPNTSSPSKTQSNVCTVTKKDT